MVKFKNIILLTYKLALWVVKKPSNTPKTPAKPATSAPDDIIIIPKLKF